MKRFFLSSICTLAMLVFTGSTLLVAQQEIPANESRKVVIIQKTTNDDGTVTVKKKSIAKGQDPQSYLEQLDLQEASGKSEIVIVTEGGAEELNVEGETLMFFRKSKSHGEEKPGEMNMMWRDLDELRIKAPHHEFRMDVKGIEKKTYLGVYPQTSENGVLLTGVVSGSGAQEAGLQANDVMTAINGKAIRMTGDLSKELATYQPGDEVRITYLRNGSSMETTAKLSAPKATHYEFNWKEERDPCKVFYGVYVGSHGEGLEGVGVAGIVTEGGWPAEKAGLQKGDRIIAIDAIPVNSHRELVIERDKHKPGEAFTFTILRDGYPMDIDSRFKECPNEPEAPVVETVPEDLLPEMPPVEQNDHALELEELNAYPNPTFGRLNVKFSGEAVPTLLTITDLAGKVVLRENLPNFDGHYNRELDISNGTPGALMLSIRQGDKIITKPIVLLNRA